MNREIKFKAFDKQHPERGIFEIPMNDYNTGDFFGNDRFMVMQYTSIRDGNGKEIYEGDLLKFSNYTPISEAVFEDGVFVLKVHGFNPKIGNPNLCDVLKWRPNLFIVGNICEPNNILII